MQLAVNFLREEALPLLRQLDKDKEPTWGKMNAQQMVEHLSLLTALSTGKVKAKPYFDAERLAQNKAYTLDALRPLPRNIQVKDLPSTPPPLRYSSLEDATAQLESLLQSFFQVFEQDPQTTFVHPVFGALDFDGWSRFHYLHFKHHFTQFGLIEEEVSSK